MFIAILIQNSNKIISFLSQNLISNQQALLLI